MQCCTTLGGSVDATLRNNGTAQHHSVSIGAGVSHRSAYTSTMYKVSHHCRPAQKQYWHWHYEYRSLVLTRTGTETGTAIDTVALTPPTACAASTRSTAVTCMPCYPYYFHGHRLSDTVFVPSYLSELAEECGGVWVSARDMDAPDGGGGDSDDSDDDEHAKRSVLSCVGIVFHVTGVSHSPRALLPAITINETTRA